MSANRLPPLNAVVSGVANASLRANGASSTAATLTGLLDAVPASMPSLTVKLMVRFAVLGVSELSV